MKKRLFLLLCGVMCLFLALCSCGDDTENDGHDHGNSNTGSSITSDASTSDSSSSGNDNTGTSNSDNNNINNNTDNKNEVSAPETPCELNSLGHYWSKVSINKNTSASGRSSVSISGNAWCIFRRRVSVVWPSPPTIT